MVSEETWKKIRESDRGQKSTEETRRKMSEAQKKRFEDPEERKKIRAVQKRRWGTDPTTPTEREITCEIIKKHHEILKEDPDHLPTEFIQKLIGIDC